jgi:hypothetical protein
MEKCQKCFLEVEICSYQEYGALYLCLECLHDLDKILQKVAMDYIQPERSKREDLDCCKRLKRLQDCLYDMYDYEGHSYGDTDLIEELIEESKMRCSEHKG